MAVGEHGVRRAATGCSGLTLDALDGWSARVHSLWDSVRVNRVPAAASRSRRARALTWTMDAALDAGPWLIVWAIAAAFGFWHVPGGVSDREAAREAQRSGVVASPIAVEVHVDYESAKYGGWHEVDGVRVLLSQSEKWRELDAVANADTLPEDRAWDEGWQMATKDTGYDLPLNVRVVRDDSGRVTQVVAEDDVTYWTVDNHDPEIGLGIGVVSVLMGVGGAAILAFWSNRSSRPAGPQYPGSTRAERRVARDKEMRAALAEKKARRGRRWWARGAAR